jgi:RNA polymerase sigma factor (sigma-70 family)
MRTEELGREQRHAQEARRVTRLEDLYQQYADDAIRFAYLLTGERETAEDLVQDAFVRVARRLGHLRNPEAFWSYLRQTITNLANSYFRRRSIERAYLARELELADAKAEERDPSRAVALRATLSEKLLRIPLRQRTAIVLRFSEDLSDEQIAEALHTSRGNARQLIYRGLTTLRQDDEEGGITHGD